MDPSPGSGSSPLCSRSRLHPRRASWTRIDAHVHVFNASSDFFRLLSRLEVRVVNIRVADKHDKGF